MTTAGVIRIILVVDLVAMALFAMLYLRQRRMSWTAFCCWSLLALAVPVLGPFLVISNRPGSWDPDLDIKQDFRRAAAFMRNLFVFSQRIARRTGDLLAGARQLGARQTGARPPAGIYHATTRLERARQRRQAKQKDHQE